MGAAFRSHRSICGGWHSFGPLTTKPNNMKKITLLVAAAALAGGAMAQSNQLSFGVDLGLPMGDFGDVSSLIVGPTVGFELPVGEKVGVTVQAGYDIVMLKEEFKDFFDSYSMIPAQAGLKYYFQGPQEGLYAHGQIGIHSSSVKVGDESESNTNMSWAIGAGYMMEKLDIGLRYNSISPDSDAADDAKASTYIGLRVAYLLNLGN